MQTATRYKTTERSDGLLVQGVVLAVTGDTGRGYALSASDFDSFVERFDSRISRKFKGAFVRLGHGGPRIGVIEKLSRDGENLVGDLLFEATRDEGGRLRDRIAGDEITDLSITFSRQAKTLVDVSLLDDTFGQLHEKLPPFNIDLKTEFDLDADEIVELSIKRDTELEMNIEDIKKAMGEVVKPLSDRLDKLESADTKSKSASLIDDPELEAEFETQYGNKLKEIEQREMKRDIDSKVTQLSYVAGGSTSKQERLWREKLEEFAGRPDALNERFERMKEQLTARKGSTQLEPEGQFGRLGVTAQLKEEFAALGGKERLGVSEHEYVNMSKALSDDLR